MGFRDGLYWPKGMREAPILDPEARPEGIARRHALLFNPFYPKDPHASFGKHVLTPTLALTTIAAATPAEWSVAYWDENLLQGPPPLEAVSRGRRDHRAPHLREAGVRAGALVPGARRQGRPRRAARALLSGRSARRTPMRSRSAKACSSGRGSCATSRPGSSQPRLPGQLPRRSTATSRRRARDLLPRARLSSPPSSLIATRGCHNRCGFCYLATDGLAHAVPDARRRAGRGGVRRRRPAVRRLHRQQPRLEAATTCASSAARCAPLEKIWSAAVTIDVTDDPSLVREMALVGLHRASSSASSRSIRRTSRRRARGARGRTTTRGASRSCTSTASR